MHVHTEIRIFPDKIKNMFESATGTDAVRANSNRKLTYVTGRNPPKFFLSGLSVTPPAAAEVAILAQPSGSEVVLRLMWGPLPAPFPRALALVGLLLGLGIAFFSNGSAADWILASTIALLPIAALAYQIKGEQQIQSQLGKLLGGSSFTPKPH